MFDIMCIIFNERTVYQMEEKKIETSKGSKLFPILTAIVAIITVAVIAFAIYIGYFATTDVYLEPNSAFQLGAWNEKKFTNFFVNLTFDLPDDMQIYDEEIDNYKREDLHPSFLAIKKDDNNDKVRMDFIDLKKVYLGQTKTAEEYALSLRKTASVKVDSLKNLPAGEKLETRTISNREFYVAYEYTDAEGYNTGAYVQRFDNYICLINIKTKEPLDERLSCFGVYK